LNCEIHKSLTKCWKNQSSFWHQSSPEPKSFDDAFNTSGVERIRVKNLRIAVNTEGHSIQVGMKGALVTVEICVLCGW